MLTVSLTDDIFNDETVYLKWVPFNSDKTKPKKIYDVKREYIHCTNEHSLMSILEDGKINYAHEGLYAGAFVSTIPATGYGTHCLILSDEIEKFHVLRSRCFTDECYVGFANDIPINKSTLVGILLPNENKKLTKRIKQRHNVPIANVFEKRYEMLNKTKNGVAFPIDWNSDTDLKKLNQSYIKSRKKEKSKDSGIPINKIRRGISYISSHIPLAFVKKIIKPMKYADMYKRYSKCVQKNGHVACIVAEGTNQIVIYGLSAVAIKGSITSIAIAMTPTGITQYVGAAGFATSAKLYFDSDVHAMKCYNLILNLFDKKDENFVRNKLTYKQQFDKLYGLLKDKSRTNQSMRTTTNLSIIANINQSVRATTISLVKNDKLVTKSIRTTTTQFLEPVKRAIIDDMFVKSKTIKIIDRVVLSHPVTQQMYVLEIPHDIQQMIIAINGLTRHGNSICEWLKNNKMEIVKYYDRYQNFSHEFEQFNRQSIQILDDTKIIDKMSKPDDTLKKSYHVNYFNAGNPAGYSKNAVLDNGVSISYSVNGSGGNGSGGGGSMKVGGWEIVGTALLTVTIKLGGAGGGFCTIA